VKSGLAAFTVCWIAILLTLALAYAAIISHGLGYR
jgi:hypothetical protein